MTNLIDNTKPKTIDTLVEDIYNLFENGHDCDEKKVEEFGVRLANTIASRLKAYKEKRKQTGLRMSNIGKPARQVYYDIHSSRFPTPEKLTPDTKFKFLYGDILEEVVLFLAREAGHTVEHEQKEVELNGVLGHIDAVIDGVLTDVKSASKFSFKKFEERTLPEDDPFGYMYQLSGYNQALGGVDSGFLAVGKELGKLTFMPVSKDVAEMYHPSQRIETLREALSKDTPPERCYDAEPMGKSGNKKLPIGCSYCSHKFHCWSDANDGKGLRIFNYSNGPVFLTEVGKEPNVPEIEGNDYGR